MGKFDVEKIFVKLMSTHKMVTRSKKGSSTKKKNIPPSQEFDEDDIDNYGNLKGFIDYDCNEPIDFKDMIIIDLSLIHAVCLVKWYLLDQP